LAIRKLVTNVGFFLGNYLHS